MTRTPSIYAARRCAQTVMDRWMHAKNSVYLWQIPFTNRDWHSVWATFPFNIGADAGLCVRFPLLD
jgi:hypothetical protein